MNKCHLVDCNNFMKGIPDKYYELSIIDPPYGIGVNHNMGRRKGDLASSYEKVNWDNEPPGQSFFDELIRISKNQIIWGANHFISKIPFDSSCWIVWDKLFSADVSFASCELAWTSFESVTKRFAYSSARKDGIHPTQKPVALYKWLLKNYAKPNDKIFDSHVGSGSSRIACYDMGFDFEGCELDLDYWKAQEERFEQHTMQGDLFSGEDLQESMMKRLD